MSILRLAYQSMLGVTQSTGGGGKQDPIGRVRPLDPSQWSPEVRQLLDATLHRVADLEGRDVSAAPKTLNILRTIAHLPKLLGPFLGFATTLTQAGVLTRRDSELLALRTAWNCQSNFEWGHHVVYARAAGLSEDEIERIAVEGPTGDWSAADRHLLQAADQLHVHQQIDDEIWTALSGCHSEAQLVEIPFVVGQYTMLSMVANSTGVELEDGFPALPRLAPKPTGEG